MKLIALLTCVALLGFFGCATHTVRESVVAHYDLDIKLRSQREWFGGAVPLGYSQPIHISSQRLEKILSGIEVDVRNSNSSVIRQRRNALSSKLLQNISENLPEAFAEASPNQQIIVMAQRKQMQKGIFNRKYLTSFTTYIEGEYLYVFFSRIEWKLEDQTKDTRIPEPWPGQNIMPFETVASHGYERVGRQGLRVLWQSRAFGSSEADDTPIAVETKAPPTAAPVSSAEPTSGQQASPSKATESPTETTVSAPGPKGSTPPAASGSAAHNALEGLSATDLRELANLEDAYRSGRMDRDQYLQKKARILDRGN